MPLSLSSSSQERKESSESSDRPRSSNGAVLQSDGSLNATVRQRQESSDDALAFLTLHPCQLVDGDRIQLPAGLSPDLVSQARNLKPALLELLREAAQDLAEERAGILEFCAGFDRLEAERRAGIAPQVACARLCQETEHKGDGTHA